MVAMGNMNPLPEMILSCQAVVSGLIFLNSRLLSATTIDWMSLIVAKVSPWIRVDNENGMIRTNSEKVCQLQ